MIEFLGLWERLHNPNFNPLEFEGFRKQAGTNAFTMSPKKWIEATNAIGIVSKAGRYGGTYAHSDIAMSFATWISPEFQLYIMKDYRRLKTDENSRLSLNWNLNREISKLNYRIHGGYIHCPSSTNNPMIRLKDDSKAKVDHCILIKEQ